MRVSRKFSSMAYWHVVFIGHRIQGIRLTTLRANGSLVIIMCGNRTSHEESQVVHGVVKKNCPYLLTPQMAFGDCGKERQGKFCTRTEGTSEMPRGEYEEPWNPIKTRQLLPSWYKTDEEERKREKGKRKKEVRKRSGKARLVMAATSHHASSVKPSREMQTPILPTSVTKEKTFWLSLRNGLPERNLSNNHERR